MKKIRIGITGGAGYTGGELIRILLHHAHTELVFVHSKSHNGQLISHVHQDLAGDTGLLFLRPYFAGYRSVVPLCRSWGSAENSFRKIL